MFIAGLVKMLPVPKTVTPALEASCYEQLIHSLFRPADQGAQKPKLIAFTSASSGAGTSSVLREIGDELACYAEKKTVVVDAKKLQTYPKADLEKWLRLCTTTGANLSFLKSEGETAIALNGDAGKATNGKTPATLSKTQKKALARQRRAVSQEDNLNLLSKHFDHVLIDCQSIKNSSETMLLTKLVDGVVIVVAAGQTRRDDIQRSQRVIETAEGKVLGFVLTKRKYPVPSWLYRRI